MTSLIAAALAGLGFGLSLIVAIGAQNAYVLRQGLRKEHVFVIVAICALSDALLIAVGVAGLGAIIQQLEWLLLLIELIGGASGAAESVVRAGVSVRGRVIPERAAGATEDHIATWPGNWPKRAGVKPAIGSLEGTTP